MTEEHTTSRKAVALRIAQETVDRCVSAALRAYEDAKVSGLCDEGALEVAIGAIRSVDAEAVVDAHLEEGETPRAV